MGSGSSSGGKPSSTSNGSSWNDGDDTTPGEGDGGNQWWDVEVFTYPNP
jgi:hypothetical protein